MKRIHDLRESDEYRDPANHFVRGQSAAQLHTSDGRVFDAVAVEMKVRPSWPEELAKGRAALIPRLLYLLADRTGRPLPRRWARRLDRRLAPFYESARRQAAMYEALARRMSGGERVRSGTIKIAHISTEWVRTFTRYFDDLDYQARVAARATERLNLQLRTAAAEIALEEGQPWSRRWWRWLWRYMKLEARAGYRDATGYWTVTR